MPDMDKDVFDDFWTNLYQKSPKFVPNTTIQQLLNRTILLKEEIKEDEPDYSALDVEIDIKDNEVNSSFIHSFIKRDNCYHCLQCQYMSDQLTNIR